jgi:hypothetical protein
MRFCKNIFTALHLPSSRGCGDDQPARGYFAGGGNVQRVFAGDGQAILRRQLAYANFPNGIPAIEVPYNQPDVSVATTVYQSYFTSGPIPAYAPVEGTSNSSGDRHVLVYLEAGQRKQSGAL